MSGDFETCINVEANEVTEAELRAYNVLVKNGYSIVVKGVDPKDREQGNTSPDVVIDGHRWELKCPDGANKNRTITRNINKAVHQLRNANPPASSIRIIISCLETTLSQQNVLHHVKSKISEGVVDEAIVILSYDKVVKLGK